jgi:oligopeptide/dipeptide ABC transporter ATP-binding protein
VTGAVQTVAPHAVRTVEPPALSVTDLSVRLETPNGPVAILDNINLEVGRAATHVVLGESGSGKSVTIKALLGLLPRPAWSVTGSGVVEGVDLIGASRATMNELLCTKVGFIPQDPRHAFDPLRQIGSQIAEVMVVHGAAPTKATGRTRALELLALVGISDPKRVAKSYPHQLSGGMCQRAAIALAISCDPVLILADEPTSALDVTVQAHILETIAELQSTFGTAMLMVTHDIGLAADLGGEVTVMYAGRVVSDGSTDAVLNRTRHPYVYGLLRSLPTPGQAHVELASIPGSPPLPAEYGVGCRFAPRCAFSEEGCDVIEPQLVAVEEHQRTACRVWEKEPVA